VTAARLALAYAMDGVNAGAYKGTITLAFGAGSTQIVQLLLVLSPGASSSASVHRFSARYSLMSHIIDRIRVFFST
jgi:hypothetical protein